MHIKHDTLGQFLFKQYTLHLNHKCQASCALDPAQKSGILLTYIFSD